MTRHPSCTSYCNTKLIGTRTHTGLRNAVLGIGPELRGAHGAQRRLVECRIARRLLPSRPALAGRRRRPARASSPRPARPPARARRIDRVGLDEVAELRRPRPSWAPVRHRRRRCVTGAPRPARRPAWTGLGGGGLGLAAAAAAWPRSGSPAAAGRAAAGRAPMARSAGGGVVRRRRLGQRRLGRRRSSALSTSGAAGWSAGTMRTSSEVISPTISFAGSIWVSAHPPPTWKKITSARTRRASSSDSGSPDRPAPERRPTAP